jgi:hypothetical protein
MQANKCQDFSDICWLPFGIRLLLYAFCSIIVCLCWGTEIPDAGSDISVSPVSTPPTSDNESDFDEDTWSRNLRKPNVRDFNDRFGATFTLEDNQQEKDFFNKFFPRELIEKITTETNNYATKCIEEKPDPKWKPTNVTEILAFIGLHVVMSVIQLPSYTLG